jgi:ABC-2 type transport system permease protein
MVKLTLFFVRLLQRPLIWMGADFGQLLIILRTKLTLDFRRGPSGSQSSGNKKLTFSKQLLMFVILGLFVSLGFFSIHNLLLNFTIAYSVIMVMTATTLITEFTSVLFDQRDNHIILVRPVSSRTLLLSRLLHIQFYVMYIALALSAITVVVIVFIFGAWTALFFIIGVVLSTWITVLLTTLFYLLVSKLVSGERFKDMINYVQIFLAVIVMGGYQFLPRMMEGETVRNFSMTVHGWTYLIPPAWLAAWVQLSIPSGVDYKIILLSLPAFIVALGGGMLMVRFLSVGYNNILTQSSEGAETIENTDGRGIKRANGIYKLFCVSEYEKSGWKLVMSVTRRDRKFKQAVYPSYGFMLVMAFVMLHPDLNNLSGWLEQLRDSQRYLIFIFFGFFTTTSITQMQYTDTPEAGWIYKALPIASPGHILTGAIKAMLVKFFVPMYSLLIIAVFLIWGTSKLPFMFFGAVLIVTSTLITLTVQQTSLPFTQPREMQQKGTNFLKNMAGLLVMGVLVGIVYLASFLPNWAIWLFSVLMFFANTLFYKDMRKTNYLVER